jgi:hypothetical protein
MSEENETLKSGLTVLVVDEPVITDFLCKALIFTGHTPIIYNDSKKARDEFQKNPEAFDAVILDSRIFVPELINELVEHWQLPVLVWSQSVSVDDVKHKNERITLLKKSIINHFSDILLWLDQIEPQTPHLKEVSELFYLMYISKKVDHFLEDDLIHILNSSRKNNKKQGITGVLIYNKGHFLQILDGSRESVNTVFHEHILKDKRHENIVTLSQGLMAKRDFVNWDMGFYGTTGHHNYDLLANTNLNTHPAGDIIQKRLRTVQSMINQFMGNSSNSQI